MEKVKTPEYFPKALSSKVLYVHDLEEADFYLAQPTSLLRHHYWYQIAVIRLGSDEMIGSVTGTNRLTSCQDAKMTVEIRPVHLSVLSMYSMMSSSHPLSFLHPLLQLKLVDRSIVIRDIVRRMNSNVSGAPSPVVSLHCVS